MHFRFVFPSVFVVYQTVDLLVLGKCKCTNSVVYLAHRGVKVHVKMENIHVAGYFKGLYISRIPSLSMSIGSNFFAMDSVSH